MHINGELENVFIERINSWTLPDFDPSEYGRMWYYRDQEMFVYNNGRSIVPIVDYQMLSTLSEQQIIVVDSVTFEYNLYGNDYYRQFWRENADTNPMTFTHTPAHWTFGKHLIIAQDPSLDPDECEFYIELPRYRKRGEIGRPPLEMGSFRITNASGNVINIISDIFNNLGGGDAVYTSSTKINPGTTALFQLFHDHIDTNDEESESTRWAVIFEETAASGGSNESNVIDLSGTYDQNMDDTTEYAYNVNIPFSSIFPGPEGDGYNSIHTMSFRMNVSASTPGGSPIGSLIVDYVNGKIRMLTDFTYGDDGAAVSLPFEPVERPTSDAVLILHDVDLSHETYNNQGDGIHNIQLKFRVLTPDNVVGDGSWDIGPELELKGKLEISSIGWAAA